MDGNGLQIAGVFLTFFNHIQVGSAFRAVIYHVNIDLRENNFLVKKIAHTQCLKNVPLEKKTLRYFSFYLNFRDKNDF